MNDEKRLIIKEFPLLNLPGEDLVNPDSKVTGYMVLDEARRYIRQVARQGGFVNTSTHEVEVRNWRLAKDEVAVYAVDDATTLLPVYQLKDLQDKISNAARTHREDKNQLLRNLRVAFREPAEEMLKKYGDDPQDLGEREVVDFMLRGAYFKYSDQMTLSQNAAAFLFEREQAKIVKAQNEKSDGANRPAKKFDY